jgi:hypothetical protein
MKIMSENEKDPAGYPLTHSYENQLRSLGEGRQFSLATCAAEEIKRLKDRIEKAQAELIKAAAEIAGSDDEHQRLAESASQLLQVARACGADLSECKSPHDLPSLLNSLSNYLCGRSL